MEKKRKIAKKIIAGIITEENRRKISQFLKDRSRTSMIRQVSRKNEFHLDAIAHNCLKHVRPVTAPLTLISPLNHIGGAFLNRLLDGHPEIHSLPHELVAGFFGSGLRSEFDHDLAPQDLIEKLFDDIAGIQNRFKQSDGNGPPPGFIFLPLIQEQIFRKYLDSADTREKRKVYEAYFTACFGAWLDYQNVSGDKKFTTVCVPWEATKQEGIDSFFEIYPDGRLICLIPDPRIWYRTALHAEPEVCADVRESIKRWKDEINSALKAKERFAGHICLISVDDLVDKTEMVMRHVAAFLGLQYDPLLLTPTFNGYPVSADDFINITGAVEENSIGEPKPDEDQLKLITEMTKDDYQSALKQVIRV
jgi:hypothetical protein